MFDEYLTYGFYVKGIHRVPTAGMMKDRRVIRWIKNEGAKRNLSHRQWLRFLDDYYRDAPVIFKRKRTRDGQWKEFYLPLTRAFDGVDSHWFEDFFQPVPMNKLPRLPRKEARLRVFVLCALFRSMRDR